MISEAGIPLGKMKTFNPDVFFSNKDEESLDSLIIALAAWFNDLKTYELHNMQAEALATTYREKKARQEPFTTEDHLSIRLSSSYKSHANRLIAAHIIELLETIHKNEETLKHPTFIKAANLIPKGRRQENLSAILSLGLGNKASNQILSKKFLEFKSLLAKMRANGTYHYYNTKHFMKGYQHYFKNQTVNDPFYCLTELTGGTRFFFADRTQEATLEELDDGHAEGLHWFSFTAQHAIKDLVEVYIQMKEKIHPRRNFSEWTFKRR